MKGPLYFLEKKLDWNPRVDLANIQSKRIAKQSGIIATMGAGILIGTGVYVGEQIIANVQLQVDVANQNALELAAESGVDVLGATATGVVVLGGYELASLGVMAFRRARNIGYEDHVNETVD